MSIAYATILARYFGMKVRITTNLARRLPYADPDQRDYLVEIEYCRTVLATEMGVPSFDEWCRGKEQSVEGLQKLVGTLQSRIASLEAIVQRGAKNAE